MLFYSYILSSILLRKYYVDILKPLFKNCRHVKCVAHILALVVFILASPTGCVYYLCNQKLAEVTAYDNKAIASALASSGK